MNIEYQEWNPTVKSMKLVNIANEIIEEYAQQDLILSLRQLYYQFVARDLIENTERSYKNLGTLVTKGRMAGLISWLSIEDRNREHKSHWTAESADDEIRDLPNYIRFDQWARQETYVEVWVEKEALGNIVERACDPLLVPWMACKGYMSASEAWRAGRRFKRKAEEGKNCVLIHLGDHDPSGLDMTRDNDHRTQLFSNFAGVRVERIALNMDQIDDFNPPPNPTKLTDSRATEYVAQYGETSWELDALDPQTMIDLITDTINPYIDQDVWRATKAMQSGVENELAKLGDNWEEVKKFLSHF